MNGPTGKDTSSGPSSVLAFEEVCRWNGGAGDGFTLTLREGDLAVFAGVPSNLLHDPGDLALGLSAPVHGRIRFLGETWPSMGPREEERRRRLTGRVLAVPGRAAWLQNLDVEENVLLARRFDGGGNFEEILGRCRHLCARFGLDHLPGTRPSSTPAETLVRAQWVRAFLPEPLRLLILECPESGVSPELAGRFRRHLRRVRASGTAVVWIDSGSPVGLGETVRYDTLPPGLRRRAP